MGRILGILGSLALGLMLAGVGILMNAWVLIYSGAAIFVLMCALWLYSWARPVRIEVPVPVPVSTSPPQAEPTEAKARAVWTARKARDNAAIAVHQGNAVTSERAYNEVRAALLTVKREFGFGPLKLSGKGSVPYQSLLKAFILYMDRIIPLLSEGHVEDARSAAMAFGWQWQEPEEGLDCKLIPERPA